MNTKASVGLGWAAYTLACTTGGAIGWHRYYYAPGGRRDREAEATVAEARREAEEAALEARVRAERAAARRVSESGRESGRESGSKRESANARVEGANSGVEGGMARVVEAASVARSGLGQGDG